MSKRTPSPEPTITLYVASDGNDRWSGATASSNARRTDGPLATVQGAQRAIRRLRREGRTGSVTVLLRGGTYYLRQPLVFTPADGGALAPGKSAAEATATVTYAAYPGEQPVLSGGVRLTGWQKTVVNGHRAWVTVVPVAALPDAGFQQLWVNGERRARSRLPREGFHRIERLVGVTAKTPYHQGQDRFGYAAGDLDPSWRNLHDVEVVALSYWTESRLWLQRLDRRRRLAVFDRTSSKRLTDDFDASRPTQYYVENVFEALQPGEWYLDRGEGRIYYLPLPDEEIDRVEVIVPRLTELVRLQGEGKPVCQLHFEGIAFSHNQWHLPPDLSNVGQASHQIPGAVVMQQARACTFRCCAFVHLGSYGVELLDGCRDVSLEGCTVTDLGAGGVKVWHGCGRITLSDCTVSHGGLLYPSAVGVLIGQSSGNKVLHNHIHHFYYTGISVGWSWGYEESEGYGNIVEYNHVHDIGQGMLSDMGGIYTLGVSQGTRIRYNLFHDITSRGYGGWAIYTDEGSSDILIENNLSYRTNCAPFHQHYGRDNLVQNNIWAFGRTEQLALTRLEGHRSLAFRRNIVLFTEGAVIGSSLPRATPAQVEIDGNLYWRTDGRPFRFGDRTFREWQRQGMDRHGLIADPCFVDAAQGDFRLRPDSPAFGLGFQPFDLSTVGPRPERTAVR